MTNISMAPLRYGWIAAALLCSAAMLKAQQPPATTPPRHADLIAANFQPLDAMRRGEAPMPSKLARTITLTRERVLLQQVLLDIATQAGLGLSYGDDLARSETVVSIDIARVSAADALAAAVRGTEWAVFVNDAEQVTVVRDVKQNGTISGVVTDSETGEGVDGVGVSLEGTQWRTTTDATGRYRLEDVAPGSYTLVTQRISYASARRAVTVNDGQDVVADMALHAAATQLGEVVVTAQKREERMQDVPLSIAVVTSDAIDRRGLFGAEDYLRGMAGVNQTDVGYGGQAIIIRGLETTTLFQNFYASSTTATYFGETPTTSSSGILGSNVDIKLVDIERVEVLRGPQGTAFGSASMGGAIRMIPVAPKVDRVEGKVAAGYSATAGTGGDNYNVYAVGNLPLIEDRLALRATGYRYAESGFYRNRAGSDSSFQSTIVIPYDVEAFANDRNQVGGTRFTGGRVAALLRATDALHLTLTYLTQKKETDGYPGANNGLYEQTYLGVAPEHVFRGQSGGINDDYIDIANAVIEYDLGWADLLSSYSYVEGGTKHANHVGLFGMEWPGSSTQSTPHREHSGEIRLATKFGGAWNFLGGVFAEKQDDRYVADWIWNGDPATNHFTPPERDLLDFIDRRDLTQMAAFAEASWTFLPRWTLTGGVRAYEYDRSTRVEESGPWAGGAALPTRADTTEAAGSIFRANLSYKPSAEMLLYASWAEGFRLGRPQPEVSAAICDTDGDGIIDETNVPIASTAHVDSDAVDSFELGGKLVLLGRRLVMDAAVFHIDWSRLPVGVLAPCGAGYSANVGGALSEGVEFAANLQLTDVLRFHVGGSWINARLTDDVPVQEWSAGDRLPGSPKVNANFGLQYEFDVAGRATFVRTDAAYVGPLYMDVLQSPGLRAGDYMKLDASARVGMGTFNLDLFVRNLTGEDAAVSREFSIDHRLRPRTIGLQLSRNFEL